MEGNRSQMQRLPASIDRQIEGHREVLARHGECCFVI